MVFGFDVLIKLSNPECRDPCISASSLAFLSDPGVPGVRSMGHGLCHSLSTRLCADLTDVTLADEDSNSIPTDDVNRAIPGNVAMQVAPHGCQN